MKPSDTGCVIFLRSVDTSRRKMLTQDDNKNNLNSLLKISASIITKTLEEIKEVVVSEEFKNDLGNDLQRLWNSFVIISTTSTKSIYHLMIIFF